MMKKIILFCALFLIIAASSAYGSASVATFPTKVRHTYSDGSYTEVDCSASKNPRGSTNCSLIVSDNEKTKSFRLNLIDFGYPPYEALEEHVYFPRDGVNDFMVRFPVKCNQHDIALAPNTELDSLSCMLNLEPTNESTLSGRTEIHGTNRDGSHFYQIRGSERDDT